MCIFPKPSAMSSNRTLPSANQYIGKHIDLCYLPPGARILRPGDIEIQDYVSSRLNLYLDDNNIVIRANYG